MRKISLYIISAIIIIFSILSCTKDFGVQVTQPSSDFFLSKMQSGNWSGASVNGNTLTITVGNGLNGNYTFDSPVLGVGGIYKGENGDIILAVPGPDGLVVSKTDEKGKEALDAILEVVGEEGGEKVISNLVGQVSSSGGNIDFSDPDKILAGTDLPPDKRAEVEAILKGSQGSFTGGRLLSNYES